MMPNIGAPELMIVLVLALIILGPKRLPDAGRALGSSVRNFKSAIKGDADEGAAEPEPVQVAAETPPR
jgi:sec-independent protein translocase protein TatA